MTLAPVVDREERPPRVMAGRPPARICALAFELVRSIYAVLPAADPLCRRAHKLATSVHNAAAFGGSPETLLGGPFVYPGGSDTAGRKRGLSPEHHAALAVLIRIIELGAAGERGRFCAERGKSDIVTRAWRTAHERAQRLRSDLDSRCVRDHRTSGPYLRLGVQ